MIVGPRLETAHYSLELATLGGRVIAIVVTVSWVDADAPNGSA